MRNIIKSNLTHFKNATAFAFMQLVQREAETIVDESTVEKLTDLKSKMIQFNDALTIESTKSRTKKLDDIMNMMIQYYSSLKTIAKGLSLLPVDTLAETGKVVYEVLQNSDKFGDRAISSYLTKFKTAMSAIREKTDPELLRKTYMESIVENIEKLLTEYYSIYDERNAFRIIKKNSVRKTRHEAIEAAKNIIIHLEWLEYSGNTECTSVLNRIENSVIWLKQVNKLSSADKSVDITEL